MTIYNEIVKDLTGQGYDFRINDLDDSLEVKVSAQEWARMDDVTEATMLMDMREIGYGTRQKYSFSLLKNAAIKRASQKRYNPIRDYFKQIEKCYKPRSEGAYLIPQLALYFDNPDGCFKTWLFKWMVGTVAKIHEGERNPMLVLVAPQRIGKSFFCGWLCPIKDHFYKGPINPDRKDEKIKLMSTVIWEVEELGSTTRRSDVEALKHFITLPFIYERMPYGKHPVNKPVNASFIGTVNFDGAGFLHDPTGTTRFLACEIEKIDFDYAKKFRPDELWSEALWFYRNVPGSWKLTPEEEAKQAQVNAKFEIVSALGDALETVIEVTGKDGDFLLTQDIKTVVSTYYKITNEQGFYNELARYLTATGKARPGRASASEGKQRGWHGVKHRPQAPQKKS